MAEGIGAGHGCTNASACRRPSRSPPPAVRGATLFGQGLLQNAYINVQSANQRSQFPGRLDDLPPIAGFQVPLGFVPAGMP